MGLLDRIRTTKEAVSEKSENVGNKFDQIADEMVGDRPKVHNYAQADEPGDYEFDQQSKFTPDQMNAGRQLLQQQDFSTAEFQQQVHRIDINDEYLMSLAKLKYSSLNLKSNFVVEPIRIAFGYAAKYAGRVDIQENIKTINIDDELVDFKELMVEVIFQEIKALQRANNLRIPPASEIMQQRTYMMMQKLAGEGFSNVVDVSEGIYKKIVNKQ